MAASSSSSLALGGGEVPDGSAEKTKGVLGLSAPSFTPPTPTTTPPGLPLVGESESRGATGGWAGAEGGEVGR